MLAIKLQRIGKKHQPSYRLIVQEKKEKLGGRYAEDLGWYNPILDKHEFKKERVEYWLKVGAQPTPTVHNLLVTAGIIQGQKIPVHKKPRPAEEGKGKEAEGKKVEAVAESSEAKKEEAKAEALATPAEEVKTEAQPPV